METCNPLRHYEMASVATVFTAADRKLRNSATGLIIRRAARTSWLIEKVRGAYLRNRVHARWQTGTKCATVRVLLDARDLHAADVYSALLFFLPRGFPTPTRDSPCVFCVRTIISCGLWCRVIYRNICRSSTSFALLLPCLYHLYHFLLNIYRMRTVLLLTHCCMTAINCQFTCLVPATAGSA